MQGDVALMADKFWHLPPWLVIISLTWRSTCRASSSASSSRLCRAASSSRLCARCSISNRGRACHNNKFTGGNTARVEKTTHHGHSRQFLPLEAVPSLQAAAAFHLSDSRFRPQAGSCVRLVHSQPASGASGISGCPPPFEQNDSKATS